MYSDSQAFIRILSHPMLKTSLLLVLLIASTLSQEKTQLALDQIYDLSLGANIHQEYALTIPQDIGPSDNLYISGYSVINDPYEEPIIKVSSDGYSLTCDSEQTDLNDICLIPRDKLEPGKTFTINLYCQIACTAKLVVYLGKTMELDLGDEVSIDTHDSPVEKSFRIWLPEDETFDEVRFGCAVRQFNAETEGNTILVNYGKDPQIPTESNKMEVLEEDWGTYKAVIIPKESIKAGQWIAVSIRVGSHTSLYCSSTSYIGNKRGVSINQPFYDYVAQNKERVYEIDLSAIKQYELAKNKPIFIEVLEYSGQPAVQFSLNPSFTDKETFSEASRSWLRFQITVEDQASEKFNYKAYVRVSTRWGASYVIYSRISTKSFIELVDEISQFIKLQPKSVVPLYHEKAILFEGENPVTQEFDLQHYSSNIVQMVMYACVKDGSDNQTEGWKTLCEIEDPNNFYQQLQTDAQFVPATKAGYSLKKISLKMTDQKAYVTYHPSDCIPLDETSYRKCQHLMLVYTNQSVTFNASFVLTAKRNHHAVQLREGQSYISAADVKDYQYFFFNVPSLNSISKIIIFVNTLDGDLRLLASQKVSELSIDDVANEDIKLSYSKVTFENTELKVGKIYIAVYGLQYSDFVINVIIRRDEDSNQNHTEEGLVPDQEKFDNGDAQISDIELFDGRTQKYELYEGEDRINFKITPTKIGTIKVTVSELDGRVNTSFISFGKEKGSSISCPNGQCEIQANDLSSSFRVTVKGDPLLVQSFTILYKQNEKCYTFPVGTPLYVKLQPNETDCITDSVDKTIPFEILNSLTSLQMFNKVITVSVYFPATKYEINIPNNSFIVTTDIMETGCPRNDKDCEVIVRYTASDRQAQFQTIIQKVDGVIYLYDGVSQKMSTKLSKTKAKHFEYRLFELSIIEVFFESTTHSFFTISAKIASARDVSDENKYPGSTKSTAGWLLKTNPYSPISILPLSEDSIREAIVANHISSPVLLLSIYGESEAEQTVEFTVEITQSERVLKEGQTQVGFLEEGEYVAYEIYHSGNSLLSLHTLSGKKCYEIFDEDDKQLSSGLFDDQLTIDPKEKVPVYYYIGLKDGFTNCMYQITLQNFDENIIEISANFPRHISLSNSKTNYFIYFHNRNESFRLFEMVESGDSDVYATPITSQMIESGLKDLENKLPLSNYKYSGGQSNYLKVTPNMSEFCFSCYYLIAVKSSPSVKETLVINVQDSPVVLPNKVVVDSTLNSAEFDTFVFYSNGAQSFNISVGVNYGSVLVTVFKDRAEQKLLVKQNFGKGRKQIVVNQTSGLQHDKYIIKVTAVSETTYHLQVKNGEDRGLTISEGVPIEILLTKNDTVVEFSSSRSSGDFMIMFEYLPDSKRDPLNINIEFADKASEKYKPVKIDKKNEGLIITTTFSAEKGHYKIHLASYSFNETKVIALIPKAGLTELIEGSKFIGNQEAIYKIYIPAANYALIQLFTCTGEIKLRGSTKYEELVSGAVGENEDELLHENIGGHYVIKTSNASGLYYLRVQSKQFSKNLNEADSKLIYLLRFRLISQSIPNPYQLLDAQSFAVQSVQIRRRTDITITVDNIKSIDKAATVKSIDFVYSVGLNLQEVKKFTICTPEAFTHRLSSFTDVSPDKDQVNLTFSKNQLVKRMGSRPSFAGVVASVEVELSDGTLMKDVLFVYDPIDLKAYEKKKIFTTLGFLQISVLIVLGMGGVVLLYTLFVEGQKMYAGYQSRAGADLVEEESNPNAKQNDEDVSENQLAGLPKNE